MDKELLAQILPIVEKTKEGILKGVEVAQEQMPELINQIYMWRFATSLLLFIFGLLLLIIPIRYIRCLNKLTEETDCPAFFGYGIPMFVGIIMVSCNYEWLQILIAPKLFLIEYISSLLK